MAKNIQIDGTNTLNKGAELMLVAIYEQVMENYPDAKVHYNPNELETHLPKFLEGKGVIKREIVQHGRLPSAVLRRLNLPYAYFTSKYPVKNLDLVLDGAGFQFSDQWAYTDERLNMLENYYKKLKRQGTKIILLPQAFGPFETKEGKRMVSIINNYVDIIIAREAISYDYLIDAGAKKEKVWRYPDFTLLVKGQFPEQYQSVRDKVCVIPNKKMITHTGSDTDQYLNFIVKIIEFLWQKGEDVFLLNHEGEGDLALCEEIRQNLDQKLTIVSDLDAQEVKGVIGASKLVISSRFHGVASALNQGIPCLSTSWNHKYQMLFKDFGLEDAVLAVNEKGDDALKKIESSLNNQKAIKQILTERKKVLKMEVLTMWERVWTEVVK